MKKPKIKKTKKYDITKKWIEISDNARNGKLLGVCPYCESDALRVSRSNLGEDIHAGWMERYINIIWCDKCKKGIWTADSNNKIKLPKIPVPDNVELSIHLDYDL